MKPATCRNCGKAEWNHVCSGSAAPEPPRSNAPSPNRRIRDTAVDLSRATTPPAISQAIQPPDKPDTAPSVSPADLSDEELRPFYNEVLRRKMKARRARKAK
jgi:hypothetical protein